MATQLTAYVLAIVAVFSGHAEGKSGRQETSMNDLTLNLTTQVKAVELGDSIPLQINLLNNGPSNAEVPGGDGPTQFEFLLLDDSGSKTIQSITYRKKELLKAGGLVPRAVIKTQTLQPNRFQIYKTDLAELLTVPIPAGKFQIQALYRTTGKAIIWSNKVHIEFTEKVK